MYTTPEIFDSVQTLVTPLRLICTPKTEISVMFIAERLWYKFKTRHCGTAGSTPADYHEGFRAVYETYVKLQKWSQIVEDETCGNGSVHA